MASSNTPSIFRFNLSELNTMTDWTIAEKTFLGPNQLEEVGCTSPSGICCDNSGNLYMTDGYEHCIYKIRDNGEISLLAGKNGTSGNNGYDFVKNLDARFDGPTGICCNKNGNLYISDQNNNQIRMISNGETSTFAGAKDCSSGFINGVGQEAKFDVVGDICIDHSGTIHVVDFNNYAVRRIYNNGKVVTICGAGGDGDKENISGYPLQNCNGELYGITTDLNGNVYIADYTLLKIKKITKDGWLYLHSGSGVAGDSLGTITRGVVTRRMYTCEYNDFYGMASDRSGNTYVIDNSTLDVSKVKKIDNNGNPSVVINFNGKGDWENSLASMTITPSGIVYLAAYY